MELGQVIVWNKTHDRKATIREIESLVANELLFINFYVVGDDMGQCFPDIDDAARKEYGLMEVEDEQS